MREFDVIAIGELNVDMILKGLKSMPAPGREIIAQECSIVMGSSTAICACGISKLGLKTAFLGKLGRDRFGETVLEGLKSYNIDTRHVSIDEGINTGITVSLSDRTDRALITYLGSIDALELSDIDLGILRKTRHIHVGSFFLQSRLRPGLARLFAEAKEMDVTTSLDAGWDDTGVWDYGICDVLKYTDIFLPNELEAMNITGRDNIEEALDILSGLCSTAVVKCGSKGAVAKRGDAAAGKAAYKVSPVDTTGAGDSFNAGFIYAFLKGKGLEDCLSYGNACGAISVMNIGGASACASLDAVENLIMRGHM
jgi:sugar/nucleoside kinase (ribokinase family)